VRLLPVAAAWLAGVGAAALGYPEAWVVFALGSLGASAGFLAASCPRHALLALVCGAFATLGVARYEAVRPPETPWGVALHAGTGDVTVRGVISDEPEPRGASQRFQLAVREVVRSDGSILPADGKLLVYTRAFPELAYGDTLALRGEIELPPELPDFDYREHLARRGVVATMGFPAVERLDTGGGSAVTRALIDLRWPLSDALARSLAEPEAALAQGILLGERAAIPDDLTDDFNRAGISHLVAISGSNIAIIVVALVALFAPGFGRRRAILMTIAAILVYAVFVGGSPSVLRAVAMATVWLGARFTGRPTRSMNAIVIAAAALTLWQPLTINDVAFQMSFAAIIGLAYAWPYLQSLIEPYLIRWLPSGVAVPIAAMTSATMAASFAVLPIIAANFDRISLISIPANLLAVPLFPLVIASSLLTALAGVISNDLGVLVGRAGVLPLSALVAIGRTFADIPGSSLELDGFGWPHTLATYGGLIAITVLLRRRRRPVVEERVRPSRVRPAYAASTALLAIAALVFAGNLRGDSDRLSVTVLDVGQGDAILIETAAGHNLLVDGGPDGASLMQAIGAHLDDGERRIDLIVLTHPHDDHIGGLVELAERYEIGGVLEGRTGDGPTYEAWRERLDDRGVGVRRAVEGQWIDLGDGVRIEVLNPGETAFAGTDDVNNDSVVLRLTAGDVSFLLMGDLAAEGEAALLQRHGDLGATVLKAGHHGSDGASTAAFIDAVVPEVVAVSAGAGNNHGHPSPTTLLRFAGLPLLRTDLNGDLRFETDGTRLWVEVERGEIETIEPAVVR
jgi:competence protein ComEC